jgi:hypothetical protein
VEKKAKKKKTAKKKTPANVVALEPQDGQTEDPPRVVAGEMAPQELPGVEGPGVAPVNIPELDRQVRKYNKAKNERIAKSVTEIAEKASLIAMLHGNVDRIGKGPDGTITYKCDGLVTTLTPTKEKLSVKSESDDETGEDGE